MGLEITHNRAPNFHENTQFRRIAIELKKLFIQQGWDGLLIGNPESENCSRFRADAILLYNHGLLVIDLKDYQGTINLPIEDDEFAKDKWYIEAEKDKFLLEVKGASFGNPFIQLKSYRQIFYDVINNDIILRSNIDPSRVGAVNLFSGPIKLNRDTPRNIPYYIISQESEFSNFLYDYNSPNTFSDESANALKHIFPALAWEEKIKISEHKTFENKVNEIDSDLENEINLFLQNEESEILVLESMDVTQRDGWVNYILREVSNHNIPQTETWTHSTRIREKIKKRSGITSHSLYNTIYGGPAKMEDAKETDDIESSDIEDGIQVIIPISSDFSLDENAVIILHEAHLVSRSLNQSELIRFGSGRLLEDLLKYLSLGKTKRKLICIGDPYFLSYGKEDESAIIVNTLNQLFDGSIKHYRPIPKEVNKIGKQMLRTDLANSIHNKNYNQLKYNWEEGDLALLDKPEVSNSLRMWFSDVLTAEPSNAVLVYKNDDAKTINLWIKENCLKNTKELSTGDLLLINNNVNIADETGFGGVTRLYNGMYLTVKEKLESHSEQIFIKNINTTVVLEFIKLKVQYLSIDNKPQTNIWFYNNYFKGNGKLSKEEQLAFKIFTTNRINTYKKENDFESSAEFTQLRQDNQYVLLNKEIKDYTIKFENGERVKTKLEELERELRKLERKYRKKHHQRILYHVSKTDSFLNAIIANYGWCITVHKSVGSLFENVIINARQGESNGITNESYFKWLYSGISSSQSKVFVVNPEEINPFKDCQFEDLVGENWTDTIVQQQNSFETIDFEIPKEFLDIIDSNLIENSKAAICILSKSIHKKGYILEKTARTGDYLSKAYFSTPTSSKLILLFNNNGKGIITSIRSEKNDIVHADIIEECTLEVWSKSSKKIEAVKNPIDFRKKVYEKWKTESIELGGEMCLIDSHSYQDTFQFIDNNSKIKFKIYYNGAGFFSKILIMEKTDKDISVRLKNLLFYGN